MEKNRGLPKAYSLKQLNSIQPDVFEFEGEWKSLFGSPEVGDTWFMWGNSGNGKSTACAMLAMMMSRKAKVLYLSLEEKKGKSIINKLTDAGLDAESGNFLLLPTTTIDQLIRRLHRKRSESIIIVDSLQYLGLTYDKYKQIREIFPTKTFVFVSHASGKSPKGAAADSIHYDAGVKIWVEGGRMEVKHRYEGGGGNMVVIPELAERYWNEGFSSG